MICDKVSEGSVIEQLSMMVVVLDCMANEVDQNSSAGQEPRSVTDSMLQSAHEKSRAGLGLGFFQG